MAGLFPRTPDNFRMLGLAESSSRLKDGGPRFYPDPHQLHAIVGGGTLGWLSALLSSSQQASYTDLDTTEINPMGVGFPTLPSLDDFLPPALMTPTRNGDINTRLDTWIFNEAGPGQRVVDGDDAGGAGDGNDKVKVNNGDTADYLFEQVSPQDGAAVKADSQDVHFEDDDGVLKAWVTNADIAAGIGTETLVKIHLKDTGAPVGDVSLEINTSDWRPRHLLFWAKCDHSGTPANLTADNNTAAAGGYTFSDVVNWFASCDTTRGDIHLWIDPADGHMFVVASNPGGGANEAVYSVRLLYMSDVSVDGTFTDFGDDHP